MQDTHDHRPLYVQLVDTLTKWIAEHGQANSQLPTEKELCEEYAVSRTTVRLAMSELERRGEVYRVQGKGTFISPTKEQAPNSMFNFEFSEHCDGIDPVTLASDIVETTSTGIPATIERLFGPGPTGGKRSITRLRLVHRIGDSPVAVETLYLESDLFHASTEMGERPLEELLGRINKEIARSSESYQARALFENEVPEFGSETTPALIVHHYAYRKSGELICVSELKTRTDRIRYQNYFAAS